MRCDGMCQVSVERRRHAADRKFGAIADRQQVILHGHRAVRDQPFQPHPIDHGGLRIAVVRPDDPGKIDGHVAHDALNDVGAETVVFRDRIAFTVANRCSAMIDGPLHGRIEALYVEAGAVEVWHREVGMAQRADRVDERRGTHDDGRAAAELDVRDGEPLTDGLRDQTILAA